MLRKRMVSNPKNVAPYFSCDVGAAQLSSLQSIGPDIAQSRGIGRNTFHLAELD
jgi:hypothetical protein